MIFRARTLVRPGTTLAGWAPRIMDPLMWSRVRPAPLGLSLVVLLGACASSAARPHVPLVIAEEPAPAPPAPTPPAPILQARLDSGGELWVARTLSGLTLRQAVAQLVVQWLPGSYASTSSPEFQEWAGWVEDDEIGGVYLSIGLPHSYAAKINELQARARVPLLVTSDFESGGPGMRINHSYALPSLLPQGGGTSFPPTMAFGAIGDERFAREYGRITAEEARAVGVQLNFAPVLDVNSNPLNPVINTRSFGEDPLAVARLGAAYIEGARLGGVMTTAKHFPGHGDTKTDSHVGLPVVPADWERLNAVELVPFRRAIAAGVDAVMTAHIIVEGVQGLEGAPATMDPRFMTELLRNEMGFDGLLFTDALRMGAITNRYGTAEAGVLALEAGADVLLMPTDVKETIDAVVAAVAEGRISENRIRESARRMLEAKARAGLHLERYVDLDAVDEVVGSGPHTAFADTAATRSITLVRDRLHTVPVDPDASRRVLSVTYARPNHLVAGLAFEPLLAERVRTVTARRVGQDSPDAVYDTLRALAEQADLIVVSAYVPPQSGSDEVAVPGALADFVAEVSQVRPTVTISFGNPYLLTSLPGARAYMIAWGDREVSQRAAALALFGAAPITGRLPVSIPPLYAVGDGIDRIGPETFGIPPRVDVTPVPVSVRPAMETDTALEADPADVGMSTERLAALDSLIQRAIADSTAPGVALAIGRSGGVVRLRGYGRLDWDIASATVGPSSLYDLASLTKVVATTSAAMLLVDEGLLDLDARVVDYIPWWGRGDPTKARVTIRQLLLHRGGLPPFRRFFLEMEGITAFENAIADLELDYTPGERTVYSDIGFMTLAFVIEQISGTSFDVLLANRVWRVLGMSDTRFKPDEALLARIAPTEVDTILGRGHLRGVVHDENAYAMGGVAGHAGLFSSARDLASFGRMMLSGGATGEGRLFEARTIDTFTRRYDDSSSRALGWDTPSAGSSAGDYFSAAAFGHTGFTGTSIWIDPELDIFVVLLTNRVNPTRENTKQISFRRAVHDAVALAITDRTVPRR
ncbi:MAG: glycoside hydrolase family 3 N-terminal domain-containing protein [Gemmatimonadota bacterium]|nr:MAG: glycoside hydrolase family 3 N-terminal domain-containing protein [Gemmatimonadota bacterium]